MRGTVITLLAVAGCDLDLDFQTEATSISATSDANGTTVSICAGPQDLLSCNDGVSFDVTVGDQTQRATAGFLSFGSQTAFFPPSPDGTAVHVVRVRDGADAFVELPGRFQFHARLSGSRIELDWQPSGSDRMIWSSSVFCEVSGTSYFGGDHEIEDNGQLTISIDDDIPDGEPGRFCRATVTLRRTRTGSIDQAFLDGSAIDGEQARSFSFALVR